MRIDLASGIGQAKDIRLAKVAMNGEDDNVEYKRKPRK